jgi:hypothetical protein
LGWTTTIKRISTQKPITELSSCHLVSAVLLPG